MKEISKKADERFEQITANMSKETRWFYEQNPRREYYKKLLLRYTSREATSKDLLGIAAFCGEHLIFRVKNKVKALF